MKQYLILATLVVGPTLTSNAAAFGRSGDFAVGVERVLGFQKAETEFERPGPSDRRDHTSGSFGWQGGGRNVLQEPRLGFDFLVTDGLSVGGNVGFFVEDVGNADSSGFILAPRVGYAFMFTDVVGLWPRGGLFFWSIDNDGPDASEFGLNLEAMLLIMPTASFGVQLGPVIDLGFAGDQDAGGNSEIDRSDTNFGLAVGVFGAF